MGCCVCGWPGSVHITIGKESRSYCRRHAQQVKSEIAEAMKSAPPPTPGFERRIDSCGRCGQGALVHVSEKAGGSVATQFHLCEVCAARELGPLARGGEITRRLWSRLGV